MIRPRILTILFGLLLVACANRLEGQVADSTTNQPGTTTGWPTSPPRILQVVVVGNKKTKEAVILREMRVKAGDPADAHRIEQDRRRVLSLGLFSQVEMDLAEATDGMVLLVNVSERPYYFIPFPILYPNYGYWDKLSYGAGVLHTNFRGMNENIMASAWFGYNPGFRLAYVKPWLFRKRLATTFSIFQTTVQSRSLKIPTFEEHHRGVEWSVTKGFGFFTSVTGTLGFQRVMVEPGRAGLTLSPSGKDRLPSLQVAVRYDSRDLAQYPHRGWQSQLWARQTGWRGGTANYWRYGVDGRRYQPLGEQWTLATRAMVILSRRRVPVYDRLYLGYAEHVRGHFSDITEGENLGLGSVELRFPLKAVRYYVLRAPSFVGGEQTVKFGMSAGVFAEAGAAWFQDEKLSSRKFETGFGFGLHFHLPYVEVLRLDLGFTGDFQSEYLVATGVAF